MTTVHNQSCQSATDYALLSYHQKYFFLIRALRGRGAGYRNVWYLMLCISMTNADVKKSKKLEVISEHQKVSTVILPSAGCRING